MDEIAIVEEESVNLRGSSDANLQSCKSGSGISFGPPHAFQPLKVKLLFPPFSIFVFRNPLGASMLFR